MSYFDGTRIKLHGNRELQFPGATITKTLTPGNSGILTETYSIPVSSGACIFSNTRTNIIALRNAGTLSKGCWYEINDQSFTSLGGSVRILLLATETNELSMLGYLNTTLDNSSWEINYDIDTNQFQYVFDNKNNRVHTHASVISFPWSFASWTNNYIDNNAVFTTNVNFNFTHNTVKEGSYNFTNTTNNITRCTFVACNINLSNTTVTYQYNRIANSTITAIGRTNHIITGCELDNFTLNHNSTVNLSYINSQLKNLSNTINAPITVTSCILNLTTITVNAGAGGVTLLNSTINSSGIGCFGTLTITSCNINSTQFNINVIGTTINCTQCLIDSSTLTTSGTGIITVNNSSLISNASLNSSVGNLRLIRSLVSTNSSLVHNTAAGTSNLNDSKFINNSSFINSQATLSFNGVELNTATFSKTLAGNPTMFFCKFGGQSNITLAQSNLQMLRTVIDGSSTFTSNNVDNGQILGCNFINLSTVTSLGNATAFRAISVTVQNNSNATFNNCTTPNIQRIMILNQSQFTATNVSGDIFAASVSDGATLNMTNHAGTMVRATINGFANVTANKNVGFSCNNITVQNVNRIFAAGVNTINGIATPVAIASNI